MKKTFQERIIEIMDEKGITQADISRVTNITQSSLSDYIKGKYSPKQDKIDLIAQALHVSPAYLMGWEDEKNETPTTVAAHATDDLTEEEQEKVNEYIQFLKSKRGL